MVDLERAKFSPSVVFASPQEVVEHDAFTLAEKVAILERWRQTALQLETAQGENMQSNRESRLRQVLLALRQLKAQQDT